jgi:hypothetical protein
MNTLKRKGPRTEPCGTPELAGKDCERMPDNNNSIQFFNYFCAQSTTTRPITDTAQRRYNNNNNTII